MLNFCPTLKNRFWGESSPVNKDAPRYGDDSARPASYFRSSFHSVPAFIVAPVSARLLYSLVPRPALAIVVWERDRDYARARHRFFSGCTSGSRTLLLQRYALRILQLQPRADYRGVPPETASPTMSRLGVIETVIVLVILAAAAHPGELE